MSWLLRVCAAAPAALLLLLAPSAAHAASFNCSASALRVTLGPGPAIEPVTANAGSPACTPQSAGGGLPMTPLPLSSNGVFANTTFTGTDPLSQIAGASAGIGTLSLTAVMPGLPAPDLSGIPGGGVFSVP